jgi:transcription elongation factor Elf1
MDICFNCPRCGENLAVESKGAGMILNCPTCKEQIEIPHASTASRARPRLSPPPDTTSIPPPLPEFQKCPFCAEQVALDAIKCKHCGSSLAASPPMTPEQLQRQQALQSMLNGKFSCPKCHSQKTVCDRDIDCAILIIIFISLGLGLIMIPFLP